MADLPPTLPACPPSAKELIKQAMDKLDPRGPFGAHMDDLAAKKANASEGLLGVPLIDDLLDQTAGFLQEAAGALVNELAAAAVAELGDSLAEAGARLAMVVAIVSMPWTIGMLLQIMLFEKLRAQVAIRLFWLETVQFHYREIYKVLMMLKAPSSGTQNKPNTSKLIMALNHVKKAESAIIAYKTLEENSGAPRIKQNYFRTTFIEVDAAIKCLLADPYDGTLAKELISDIQKSGGIGSKKKIDTKLKKIGKAFDKYGTALAKQYKAKVLGRTVYIMEALAWHNAHLLPAVPIPGVGALVANINVTNVALDLGYEGAKFDKTAADLKLKAIWKTARERHKATLVSSSSVEGGDSVAVTLDNVAALVEDFDFQKALIGTNLIINVYVENVPTWEADWATITGMSNFLLGLVVPVEEGLALARSGMEESLKNKDNEFLVAAKEISWLITLKSLNTYKSLIGDTLGDQAARADQAANMRALKDYLKSDVVQLADNAGIVDMLRTIVGKTSFPPGSTAALNEAIVAVNVAEKQLDSYIRYNRDLHSRLGTVSLANDPTAKNLNKLMEVMERSGGTAGAMAAAMALGQLSALAGLMSMTAAGLAGLAAAGIPKCTPTPKGTDSNIEKQGKIMAAAEKQGTGEVLKA